MTTIANEYNEVFIDVFEIMLCNTWPTRGCQYSESIDRRTWKQCLGRLHSLDYLSYRYAGFDTSDITLLIQIARREAYGELQS